MRLATNSGTQGPGNANGQGLRFSFEPLRHRSAGTGRLRSGRSLRLGGREGRASPGLAAGATATFARASERIRAGRSVPVRTVAPSTRQRGGRWAVDSAAAREGGDAPGSDHQAAAMIRNSRMAASLREPPYCQAPALPDQSRPRTAAPAGHTRHGGTAAGGQATRARSPARARKSST
jgi:hypothetical protein